MHILIDLTLTFAFPLAFVYQASTRVSIPLPYQEPCGSNRSCQGVPFQALSSHFFCTHLNNHSRFFINGTLMNVNSCGKVLENNQVKNCNKVHKQIRTVKHLTGSNFSTNL